MKWILITAVLSNPQIYPNEDICRSAHREIEHLDPKAVCIPAGETKQDQMLNRFLDMIDELEKKTVDKNLHRL